MASFKRVVRALSRIFFVCAALAAVWFELSCSAVFAQTATRQRVYASGSLTTSTSALPSYSKDNTTSAVTLLPGAPFADRLEGGSRSGWWFALTAVLLTLIGLFQLRILDRKGSRWFARIAIRLAGWSQRSRGRCYCNCLGAVEWAARRACQRKS